MKKSLVFVAFIALNQSLWAANAPAKQNNFVATHPNLHQINLQTLNQKMAIRLGVQQKKISTSQKATLFSNLKSLHTLEAGFIKTDNKQDLTTGQFSQLSQILTENQQILTSAGVSLTPTTH